VTITKAITTVTIFPCCSAVLAAPEKRATISAVIDVRPDQLLVQPPGANWLSYNGDYTGRRFRSLSEITPAKVTNLRAEWILHARGANELEVTPVVVNGIMFVTSANDAFALDARTGRSHLALFMSGHRGSDRRCIAALQSRRGCLVLKSSFALP
jgi:glucose dehydrogenase